MYATLEQVNPFCPCVPEYSPDALDPHNSTSGPALSAPPQNTNAYSPLHAAPKPASPTNILLQPYPAPVDISTMNSFHANLNALAIGVAGALAVIWFLVAFRSGFWAFLIRSTLIGGTAIGTWLTTGILGRRIEKDLERVSLVCSLPSVTS